MKVSLNAKRLQLTKVDRICGIARRKKVLLDNL